MEPYWECEVQWWTWPAPQISVPKVTLGLDLSTIFYMVLIEFITGPTGCPLEQHWHEGEQGIMAGPVAVTRTPGR